MGRADGIPQVSQLWKFLNFQKRWHDGLVTTFILWDVDGTLVRNGKDAGNLYHAAVELAVGRAIDNRLPNTHGKTDGQILRETLAAHGLAEELHSAASVHLDELSRLRHESGNHRELCPGVHEALAAASDRGWVNSLLTGNSASRSRYKITGAGVDATQFDWEHSWFGETSPVRSQLTTSARAELAGHTLVIVGDTPGDDFAATAAGIPFIAVATGAYPADDLRETGAVLVIDDLETGLSELLDTVGGLKK
jgi:phosphoglycolate phosphatase-like HAD superfamily hydrolase